jgi:hypothetical protein
VARVPGARYPSRPANAPHYAAAKDGETIVQEIGIGPTGTNIWPKAAAK